MKKFKYPMEQLLVIKIKLEDQKKIAYGNARQELINEENKQKSLKEKKASYETELRNLKRNQLDLRKMKQYEQAIQAINQMIEQQCVIVKKAEVKVENARVRLSDAMIERKTQEKLKEKAWETYLQEYNAQERKEIDELTSFRYGNFSEEEK